MSRYFVRTYGDRFHIVNYLHNLYGIGVDDAWVLLTNELGGITW